MVMAFIRGLEDEVARAWQDVAQLKKQIVEMDLSMAMLSAKLHRTLSKLAHREADRAAVERASIEQGHNDMALELWVEGHRAPSDQPSLGHLMRFGDTGDGEGAATGGGQEMVWPVVRKVHKRK
jgi:regulator of replication initiation timing